MGAQLLNFQMKSTLIVSALPVAGILPFTRAFTRCLVL